MTRGIDVAYDAEVTPRTLGRKTLRWRILACAVLALVGLTSCSSDDPLTRALEAHADGDLEEAQQLYRTVLAEDPGNVYAHYNLGQIHQSRGEAAQAEQEYKAALKTDDTFVPALFNLAVMKTAGAPAEAIDLYRKALVKQPDYAAAHLNLGFLLKETGKAEEGQAEIDRAVALDPALSSRLGATPSPSPAGVATPAG